MAATLDPRRSTPGQSPGLHTDCGKDATGHENKIWHPLVVPREWYNREGLVWHSHQPVSLTVEVNGKRDMMKYAAVMQLVPQLGYVARLGQPGAAAKFQNLHLIDAKRRGSTDIHICLGDLAWVRSHATEVSTATAAATLALQSIPGEASPNFSEAGIGATEACVIAGGAAEGGVVSGTSSEGTTAHLGTSGSGSAAAAAEADAGASTDSHSPVIGDSDCKATGTSAVASRRGGCVQACSAAVDAASTAGVVAAASPPQAAAAAARGFQCGCAFCPCHYDAEQLMSQPAEKQGRDASPPYSLAVADHQMCFGKTSPTTTTGLPQATAAPPVTSAGAVSRLALPSGSGAGAPTADTSTGSAHMSHISRERLRNLCLPALLKSASQPGGGTRAAAGLGGAEAAVQPLAALPPSRRALGPGSALASMGGPAGLKDGCNAAGSADAVSAVGSGGGGSSGAGGGEEGGIIGWALVLPSKLAAKRVGDKHALVQYEIDGEIEDCKVQYRLAQLDDGRTLALQGVSRPLRGLQLLSLSETPEGDLFIRAATPGSPAAGLDTTPAAAAAMLPAADPALVLSRSSSGRQRKPSLKAREGAVEVPAGGAAAAALDVLGVGGRGAAATLAALLPAAGAAPALAAQDQMRLLQQQQKRRGRPPRGRPPLPLPAAQMRQQQQQQPNTGEYEDASMDEQMQDNQEMYGSQQVAGFGGPVGGKRSRSNAGRTASSSLDGTGCGLSAELPLVQERREREREPQQVDHLHPGVIPRRRRSSPPPQLASAAGKGCSSGAVAAGPSAAVFPGTAAAVFAGSTLPRSYPATGLSSLSPASIAAAAAAAASGAEASAGDEAATDADGGEAPVVGCRTRATIESPAAARSSRKRGAVAMAAAAAAVAAAEAPQLAVEPAAKRSRAGSLERGCSLGRALSDAGEVARLLLLQQQQQQQRWESPQGSEAAAGPASAAPDHMEAVQSRSRRPQKGRRGQQRLQEQCTTSEESDGEIAEEEEDEETSASGEGAGDDGNGAVAPALARVGSSSLQAGAAPARAKPRQRANAGKFKSKPIRHPSKITNVVRNAGAILLMIGRNPKVYEKQLRHTFGNNPDTSKALRLLGEQGKVVRSGMGYRMHPYYYTLTPGGVEEYERHLQEQGPSYSFALSMGVQLPPGDDADAAAAPAADAAAALADEGEGQQNSLEAPRPSASLEPQFRGVAGRAQAGAAAAPLPAANESGGKGSREARNPARVASRARSAATTTAGGSPRKGAAAAAQAAAAIMAAAAPAANAVGAAQAQAANLPAALWLLLAQHQQQQQQQQQQGPVAQRTDLQPLQPQLPPLQPQPMPETQPEHMQLQLPPSTQQVSAVMPPTAEAANRAASEPAMDWTSSADAGKAQAFNAAPSCQPAASCAAAAAAEGSTGKRQTTTSPPSASHDAPQQTMRESPPPCVGQQLPLAPSPGQAMQVQEASALAMPLPAATPVEGGGQAPELAMVEAAVPISMVPEQPLQAQQVTYAGQSLPYESAYPQQQPCQQQVVQQPVIKSEQDAVASSVATGPLPYSQQLPYQQQQPAPCLPQPTLEPTAAKASLDPVASTAGAAQAAYSNPYAMYGYVATPYGYVPYALYSAYAAAAAAAASGGTAGAAAPVQMPGNHAAVTLPATAAMAPASHPQQATAVASAGAYTQQYPTAAPYLAVSAAPLSSSASMPAAAAANAPLATAHVPQALQMPLQPHVPSQPQPTRAMSLDASAAQIQAVQHAQPQQMLPGVQHHVQAQQQQLLTLPQQPQPQQHSLVAPQLQPQQPHPQSHPQPQPATVPYRYVMELPCGSWRAEVPGIDGRWYYSPGFATNMQAAAAADLLMSKLRPGEPLNLGINPQEEATLSTLSVEQVQAMLWGMASSSS